MSSDRWSTGGDHDGSLDEYLRCIADPAAIHAMCEDYRAGASIDLEHDRNDLDRRVACPLLVLWGAHNPIWARFNMLDVWRHRAQTVTARRSRVVITSRKRLLTRHTPGCTSSSPNDHEPILRAVGPLYYQHRGKGLESVNAPCR